MANSINNSSTKKSKQYRVFEFDVAKWDRLDNDRVYALEEGAFDRARACIEEMRKIEDPIGRCDTRIQILDHELIRITRLRDPLTGDPTFRELLGIEKYSDYCQKTEEESLRYDADFDGPDVYRVPHNPRNRSPIGGTDFVHRQKISKIVLERLAELWRLQECLLLRLRVSEYDVENEDSRRTVAHYCRANALSKIMDEGLRLCSLSSANDPTEGRRFAHFLQYGVEFAYKGSRKNLVKHAENHPERMLALQCSFTNRRDDLNQFRLYGRDAVSGIEGSGLCLIFNMGYFDNRFADSVVTAEALSRYQKQISEENERLFRQEGVYSDYDGSRLPLYWVLYYDSTRDMLYYTPCQRERPFCTGQKRKDVIAASVCRYAYLDARRNQEGIKRLLQRVKEVFVELSRMDAEEMGWDLCIYLRHLIKDAAFRDEQEMRVVQLCPLGESSVQSLNGNGPLSRPYGPIFEKDKYSPLVKIIAGPKVKNIQQIRELMACELERRKVLRTYGPGDIDVAQSCVPLA